MVRDGAIIPVDSNERNTPLPLGCFHDPLSDAPSATTPGTARPHKLTGIERPERIPRNGVFKATWAAVQVAPEPPREWTTVTRDLWKDFGAFTLTGIAPTAMGGDALFDRIELLRSLESISGAK